jgi:hypothetical protein
MATFADWLNGMYLRMMRRFGYYRPPLTREQDAWRIILATCVERVR